VVPQQHALRCRAAPAAADEISVHMVAQPEPNNGEVSVRDLHIR
jgi:hypothetical protein